MKTPSSLAAEGTAVRTMAELFVTHPLSGWGRFPVECCNVYRPDSQRQLAAILESGAQPSLISFGLGRSYGDAPLNSQGGVICHTRLNRFLAFDAQAGVLECEAGVSLAEILQYFLPRGFFLPVTPGTKFVTVGGAIAADVHGKNHHQDGTFGNFVLDFKLLTPKGEELSCSPNNNFDVFWATHGGMGLTGVILSARIKLRPVESAWVLVDYQKATNLEDALGRMTETDVCYQYSVAWIDCLATGRHMGRAVLMRGNHAPANELPASVRDPLAEPPRRRWTLPFDLPSLALNSLTVRAFNAFYYSVHRNAARQLVDLEKFFYPLDAIRHWNRLYGRRGFVQYQVALPLEGGLEGLKEVLTQLARSRRASFLAVLKRFGKPNPGLLSFPIQGYTLALDLPVASGLIPFLHELDRVVLNYGGRIYLAKDAVMTSHSFAAMYPKLEQFRAIKSRLDARGLLSSSMARRLAIVEK
ncbi:MAG: FAD-binding oxidoreductase [Terriglobia bacterium]|jgi:FAD/FMN-containing dehydrogenase